MQINFPSEEDDSDIDRFFLPGGILDPDAIENAEEANVTHQDTPSERILPVTAPSIYGSSHRSSLPLLLPPTVPLQENPWNDLAAGVANRIESTDGTSSALNSAEAGPLIVDIPSWLPISSIACTEASGESRLRQVSGGDPLPPPPGLVPPPGFEIAVRQPPTLQWRVSYSDQLGDAQIQMPTDQIEESPAIHRTGTHDSWVSTQSHTDGNGDESSTVHSNNMETLTGVDNTMLLLVLGTQASSVSYFDSKVDVPLQNDDESTTMQTLQDKTIATAHLSSNDHLKSSTNKETVSGLSREHTKPKPDLRPTDRRVTAKDDGEPSNSNTGLAESESGAESDNSAESEHEDLLSSGGGSSSMVEGDSFSASGAKKSATRQSDEVTDGVAANETTAEADHRIGKNRATQPRGQKQSLERTYCESPEDYTQPLSSRPDFPLLSRNLPQEQHDRESLAMQACVTGLLSPLMSVISWIESAYNIAIGPVLRQSVEWIFAVIAFVLKYGFVGLSGLGNIVKLAAEEAALFHCFYEYWDPMRINRQDNGCRPTTAVTCYMGFYLTPVVCDWVMNHADFPHFTPHIISNLVLYYLSLPDRRSSTTDLTSSPRRGKLGIFSGVGGLRQQYSVQADRRQLANDLCHWILRSLRLALPFSFIMEGFSKSNASFMLISSSVRLALAYFLSLTKNGLLLSPVAWVGWSLQVLLAAYLPGGYVVDSILFFVGMALLRLVGTLHVEHEK